MNTEARAGDEAGFTLIEVLAALMILAVGLLSLEALGISAARLNTRAERQSQYVGYATSRMESALGDIRRTRALTAANAASVSLPDGATLSAKLVDRKDTNRMPGDETFTVRVVVHPPLNSPVLKAADSVTLVTTTYVP